MVILLVEFSTEVGNGVGGLPKLRILFSDCASQVANGSFSPLNGLPRFVKQLAVNLAIVNQIFA